MAVRVHWDGREIPGPCSAGPLRRETAVLEIRDGLLAPWLLQPTPELSRFPALTLERPLSADPSFLDWAGLVAPLPTGPTPEPPGFRKAVTLEYAAALGPVRFRLEAAWPSGYEVLDAFDGPARERLTLVHEGFARLDAGEP